MKSILFSTYLLVLSSCAFAAPQEQVSDNSSTVSIHFSGSFVVNLPYEMFEGANIVDGKPMFVKFGSGGYLMGTPLFNEEGTLPEGYSIHKFPRYLLGLDSLDDLPESLKKSFKGSQSELKYRLNNPEVVTYSQGGTTVYHACSQKSCESYVVKKSVKDHILMLSGSGFDLSFMKSITKGI